MFSLPRPWRKLHSRAAALAPHRIDGRLRRLSDSPSKGGVIIVAPYKASVIPRRSSRPPFPPTSFKKLEYHSPLEGESQKSSRMAKASAVGGSHKQRRMARSCAPSRVRTGQATGEG